MENKINIAELLKDCPQGMELDCTMYDNCTYEGIEDVGYIDILINTPSGRIRLTKEGCYIRHDDNAKCVIFPKGKTTWVGFQRPFKDGDIVSTESGMYIGIVKSTEDSHHCDVFCSINDEGDFFIDKNLLFSRFATEKEKQKLFDAIKANGYRWNAEKKTLEKLIEPKFKVGDRVKKNKDYISGIITNISDDDFYKVEYQGGNVSYVSLAYQNDWELVPNKFDITTLKPFEDKVLVRNDENQRWIPAFWGYKVVDGFITTFGWCKYCIPYKGNEIIFKTNNDCDDFYKTWER